MAILTEGTDQGSYGSVMVLSHAQHSAMDPSVLETVLGPVWGLERAQTNKAKGNWTVLIKLHAPTRSRANGKHRCTGDVNHPVEGHPV